MKCKRLCAWLLSLVMMFSLLPVSAAAAGIPAEYAPIFKWAGGLSKRKINVELFFENESSPLGTTSSEGEGTICNINVPNGKEIYKSDASSGCSFAANKFTFWEVWDKSGDLKLYTRSTAGHTVTVNYVYTDDESKNGSKSENVKYAEEKPFGKLDKDYGYEITVSSGDAKYEVNSLDVLRVTGGAENSEITVTYTPKDVIYIDQYYDNGSSLVKWNNTHITLNGPELLNGAAEAAVIEGEDLTDAVENYRFLPVNGVTYDFSFASLVPRKDDTWVITDLWYKDEADPLGYHWFYSHSGKTASFPFGKTELSKGSVNFCYNTPHTEKSKHHDFVATTTVEPTCTERGYTDYECRYCGKEGQREYVPSLGHDWEWKHDDTTSGAGSQHYQVCKRCNEKGITENCNFDPVPTVQGPHTCTVCKHSYTDEITPKTTPVYVYFKTVHPIDGNVRVNDGDGVTYNNNTGNNNTGEKWATLGKLTTKLEVNASNKDALGAEVKDETKFVKHQDNENFNLDLISEWVELKKDNGAAGYVKEAPFGTEAWHLNGKVNVYKLSYNANRPNGVTASVTVPDSAYYLPNWNAPVSTDDPTLQGYDFGGWYKDSDCKIKAGEKVTVAEDTTLYAKWTLAQPTADLVDDAITIYHQVNSEADWHGGNAYVDASAHQAGRTPTISYKAELDLSEMKLQENNQTASIIAAYGKNPWDKLVKAVKEAQGSLAMFSGSKIVLHVQLDKQLSTADIQNQLKLITVTSDWFELSKAGDPVVYDKNAQSLTITCVPKNTADGCSSTITLSGLNNLSLTAKAQGELSSDKDLDVVSEGYIDGTIKIYTQALKLEGMSKDAPAKNTAKLKLDVPTYSVTYRGNGADSGETTDNTAYAPGTTATVKENGFTRSRYTFTGWNMKADGSGTSYAEGDPIKMLRNVVLYAQWTRNSSRDDDDDKYYFAIQKVDAQDGHALNDAKFELYQRDSRDNKLPASRKTTAHWGTESGIALFSVSATQTRDGGSTWYYREITAPEGYVLDTKEYEISAGDFYYDDQSKAVAKAETVRNYRGTTPDLLNDSDHFAYVIGYMDGNVRPYGLISRAETTTIFFRLLKDSVRDGNLLTSNTYTDVADDYWANTAISTMTGLGIVQGRSTATFDPKAPITRAQFAAICARFDTGKSSGTQTFTDIKGHWAEKYIQRAAELGWIKGFEDGTFRPDTYITRAQAMTMINRVLNRIPEDESDLLPGMNVWPDCNPGDWFYLAVQEATNSHDFEHKAGNYETWTKLMKNPDWTRYEN